MKKESKAVAVVESEGSRVIINDVPLVPIKTDIEIKDGAFEIDGRKLLILTPEQADEVKGVKFNFYHYTDPDKVDFWIFVDESSSLISKEALVSLDHEDSFLDVCLVLVNSDSTDDRFEGPCVLKNVTSADNRFTISYVYGVLDHQSSRQDLEDVDLRHAFVIDTPCLLEGYYEKVILRSVDFGCKRGIRTRRELVISDSYIAFQQIDAGEIVILNSHICSGKINVYGDLRISGMTFSNKSFTELEGLYMTDKFDYTEIELPGYNGVVEIIRTSDKTAVVTKSNGSLISPTWDMIGEYEFADRDSWRQKLLGHISEVLFGKTYEIPRGISDIEDSVIRYIRDTVESRFRMIAMLSDARKLLEGGLVRTRPKSRLFNHYDQSQEPHVVKQLDYPWQL